MIELILSLVIIPALFLHLLRQGEIKGVTKGICFNRTMPTIYVHTRPSTYIGNSSIEKQMQ